MNNNGILLHKTMSELFRETVYINWGKEIKKELFQYFVHF